MKVEYGAEDLNDPEVKARYAEFVRKRGCPSDTYRIQDGCANCHHVFVRQEYEGNDELYCTFNASQRPPCMSKYMGENVSMAELGTSVHDEARAKWDTWKVGRDVLPQGICIFFERMVSTESEGPKELEEGMSTKQITVICGVCGVLYGTKPPESTTWYFGVCDVCGQKTGVTQARDFGQIDLNRDVIEDLHVHDDKDRFLLCTDCGAEIHVGDKATIFPGEDGKIGPVYCYLCSKARNVLIPDDGFH